MIIFFWENFSPEVPLTLKIFIKNIAKTYKDESYFELACDKVTRQGYWVLDQSDRKYVEKQHFPKKQMCFVAMGGALKKPFFELIPVGEKLNAKRLEFNRET